VSLLLELQVDEKFCVFLQRLNLELTQSEEQIRILQQELETAKDNSVTLEELRAALDLERSHSGQLSDTITLLQSDLAAEKAHSDELAR